MIFPKGGVEAEGTILFGKYQLYRVIGSGRSSTVFLAEHLGLKELRAIKRVAKKEHSFFQETAVLRKLKHPGIPIIYDLEEDSNYYYLIEEFLEGESLYALIHRQGSLTGTKVISYGIELCQIMDYLHSFEPNPILYLDLQPHNVLICKGTLKLIDFDQAVSVSQASRLKKRYGTPGCAAPEQYTDEPVDERTDIYAIGALLHYMWKGELPDRQENASPEAKTEEEDGRKARAVWEEKLEAITEQCLRRRREERYENAGEVLKDLMRLKQGVFSEGRMSLLRIAVVSSSHGMGATHVSLSISSYLAEREINALYQEQNDSRAVYAMAEYLRKKPDQYGIYHMKDRDLKPRYGRCVRLEQPEYDAIVEDYGTGLQPVSENEYDLLILVCGGKWWNMEASIRAIRFLAQKENLRIIFNHLSSETDIVLPEDITKLAFYRMPWFPMPCGKGTDLFLGEVVRRTEAGRKIRGFTKKRLTAKRKENAVRELVKRFFHFCGGAGEVPKM